METMRKEKYEAPDTAVIELQTEGIVCDSDPNYGTYDYTYAGMDETDS